MISVIIPVYNGERYIKRAIDSVWAQTFTDYEIIIVDDGSTDGTSEIIKGFGNKVNYLYQQNAGPSAARNTGIRASKGEWIAFLDSDDEWVKDKLELQVEMINKYPDLVWVTSNFYTCILSENRCAEYLKADHAKSLLKGKEYFEDYFFAFLYEAIGNMDTIMVKKHVLEDVGLFVEKQKTHEDLDIWWKIAYRWPKIGYTPEPLAIYHLGHNSLLCKPQQIELFSEFLERHLKLSAKFNRTKSFEACAKYILKRWIRSALFENKPSDIRLLLKKFGKLFSKWYIVLIWCLTSVPVMTAKSCHLISKIIRFLNIRRRVIRRPQG